MSLSQLELRHVALPLKSKVKHASHERVISDSLIVAVRLETGEVGYGEGVPREYVTGETIESTFAVLQAIDAAKAIGKPGDFIDVIKRLESLVIPETANDPRGMAGNSAHCALELAILDAYGRKFGHGLGEAILLIKADRLNRRLVPAQVRYSGAIMAGSPRKERISAWKMRLYGFRQVKIKVGVENQDDPRRLRRFRRILGQTMDVRLDANEAWAPEELMERVQPLLPYHPSVIEQPVPHAQVESLASLRPKLGAPIMLDESLCGWPDAEKSARKQFADFWNVRLSKCGGLISSMRIMDLAAREGIGLQLGCHPGESGLLSAAGRHVAARIDGLSYVEGSYDRHVLSENLTRQDITFRYGGRAAPLEGPGLGVDIDLQALERLTVRREEIDYA